ncbi:hypothetical protein [Marivirga atlantica]|jgi:hypothetical protein|uniref:Lipoprotein n=1 Tax=Marivirga atlantica TaxID=1548457 RepID=A0A937ACD6_9BACT|nr:hypothetical protein [Marivirga atlantica]MBL0763628.1 hypothetical protein [Marivirga atlantica]
MKHYLAKALIFIFTLLLIMSSCTPTTRVSQSQQTWNEYKGKDVKSVKRKNTWRKN